MSLLDDIKAKADANGDGKIDQADLEALRNGENGEMIDKLVAAADQNDDGKLDWADVKSFDLGGTVSDLKDRFFG